MSDWCKNTLMCGEKLGKKILKPHELEKGKLVFSLEKIIPLPKGVESVSNNWTREFWGTTGDAFESEVHYNKESHAYTINFITLWTMPRMAIARLSEMYGDDNFIWMGICDATDTMEIYLHDRETGLTKAMTTHEIDYYDKGAYDKMREYLLNPPTPPDKGIERYDSELKEFIR